MVSPKPQKSELEAGLEAARGIPAVAEVRTLGAVGVIALREPVRVPEVTAAAIERGVWVRPFRDLVYTMPPYVTSPDDLAAVCRVLTDAVAEVLTLLDALLGVRL